MLWTAGIVLAGAAVLSTAGCTSKVNAAGGPPPAPDAEVAVVHQQDLPIAREWMRTVEGMVNAAHAQVETAQAQIEAAKAAVTAAVAAVDTAKVNLSFTKLVSPIDGVAGVASVQVGNLVNPTSNAVTTVSTLDPIKVNFTVSE